MAAWLYEGMLMFAVSFTASYLYSSLTQQHHGLQGRAGQMFFLFIVFGIYFGWFWQKGQTIAMKTWKIKVVDKHGQDLSQWRALLRYVFSWLWFVPPLALASFLSASSSASGRGIAITLTLFVWIFVYACLSYALPNKQFLHDILAGTKLVHHEIPAKPSKS